MSIAIAQIRHMFGVKTDVSGNVCYHDDQTIVYPGGSNCILYNTDQKTQKFIPGTDKSEGITAIAVSPNHRYIAIGEKGEKATITIFDLHTLKRKKVLNSAETRSDEYIGLAFSPDSKYLVAQSGRPDWTFLYWMWERSKVMATTKTANPQNPNPEIYQVSFNPKDNTQVCVVGSAVFRVFRYNDCNFKPSFLKTPAALEAQNCLCHTWVTEDKIVIGTESGKVLLFESGEVRVEWTPNPENKIVETDDAAQSSPNSITAIVACSKGFFCACGEGTVYFYEKIDDKSFFKKANEIKIPADACNSHDPSMAEQQLIRCMTINPSEETLVISTDQGQLYYIMISSADLGKGDYTKFEILSQSFHNAPITGVDVCRRKPLVATCSLDKSIRIWNYETCNLELYKVFAEQAYSVALHPSGLYILVGFSDKLKLMNLLIDDIRTFKEIPVRTCKECSFSNGGHMFASVVGNVIQLYSTTTFVVQGQHHTLKGHNGKVRSVVWSQDDSKLISCGIDGAVYEWDIATGKRAGESVEKHCGYSGVTVTPDGKTTFAVGSDKTLKEIADSRILRTMQCGETTLSSVTLSNSGRMLFAGTMRGTLWSLKYPLSIPGDWAEYQGHGAPIVKMKISTDDQVVVTIAEDASIIFWKVQDKEGRGLKRDNIVGWAEEILITKSDLEEKNSKLKDLETKLEDKKNESEKNLKQQEMTYQNKIDELTQRFIQEMESLKTKNQVLKTDKDEEETKHEDDTAELKTSYAKMLQDLESANHLKLMSEYEKYSEMQIKMMRTEEDYKRMLEESKEGKEKALEELTSYYEIKLHDMTTKLEQCNDEAHQQSREFEEAKKQIEEDSDREILDIKHQYEKSLKEERETNMMLKGESGIMKKKFTTLQKEIDDRKEEIKKIQMENAKLHNVIRGLEKDILSFKKEISERDTTIQEKENRIYELKKKNQELEKFKFVLDYKIKELKRQIEPREKELHHLKDEIREMEKELKGFKKENDTLKLEKDDLKQKYTATDKEMLMERQRVRDVRAVLKRFKTDLHNCVGFIQEPKKFKETIKALYQKYVQEDIKTESSNEDADIQKEFNRQKEHLERSIAGLKKKIEKDSEIHKADNVRIMQENVSLIKEINDLRKELKLCRALIHDMEAAMGLDTRGKKNTPVIALPPKPVLPLMEKELEENKKIIETQQRELKRLRDQIYDLEHAMDSVRPSGTRLPRI